MLGRAVYCHLASRGWTASGTQVADPAAKGYLDASGDSCAWAPLFERARGGYVVNCIGVLKRAISEHDAASILAAIRVNSVFPHQAALVAGAHSARVIHVSTDAIFAGGRREPYVESSQPDCTDHYGRTKLLGECPAPNVLNIRCSIIGRDSHKRKGLLEWALSQPDNGEIAGYEDHLWNGVTTAQFARMCEAVICADAFAAMREASSVHHFCPNPPITKHDLLRLWVDAAGRGVRVRPARSGDASGTRILGTQYDFLRAIVPAPGPWPELLKELV
jgi:dTDP-4-dehydrorhamnose reductase